MVSLAAALRPSPPPSRAREATPPSASSASSRSPGQGQGGSSSSSLALVAAASTDAGRRLDAAFSSHAPAFAQSGGGGSRSRALLAAVAADTAAADAAAARAIHPLDAARILQREWEGAVGLLQDAAAELSASTAALLQGPCRAEEPLLVSALADAAAPAPAAAQSESLALLPLSSSPAAQSPERSRRHVASTAAAEERLGFRRIAAAAASIGLPAAQVRLTTNLKA